MVTIEARCHDYGEEGCLGVVDEAFTMRFDDIGEEPIRWCSHCGPKAAKMNKLVENWLLDANRTNEDLLDFENAIMNAETKTASKKS